MNNTPSLTTLSGLLLAGIIASGCRIQVSVDGSGIVATRSGSYECRAGAQCPSIEVTDTDFDETFTATPDEGFRFAGWRRQNRGFCGGSTNDCRLFTAGFAGNPTLLGFLERDEEFFLQAIFEPQNGEGSASVCWNPDLYAPGTTAVVRYRTTEDGITGELDIDLFIEGGATFGGQPARRRITNLALTDLSSGQVFTARNVEVFQVNGQRLRLLQDSLEFLVPDDGTQTDTFDPFELSRFDLVAGESFTQSYVETFTETTSTSQESISFTREAETRFDGIESLTVPAGTFQACRFTVIETTGSLETTTIEWFSVGSGVPLRSEEPAIGEVSELLQGSVNGVDL
ncbi:MAG: hypothetical protein AAF756_02830 [Pseudomonadota bacterium]